MKIGIITILRVNNYGAELQAFATQFVLKRLGYDAEIIDYLFYKNKNFIRTKKSAPIFSFPLKKRIAEHLYPLLEQLKSIPYKKSLKKRVERFEKFHQVNTSFSSQFCRIEDLYENPVRYNVYLSGSDQVWNPYIYSSIAPYFLDFAPQDARKVAYAASFGVSEIPTFAKETYRNYLQSYSSIGVREKNAVDIIKNIAGKDAQWVLDPTLLLSKEEWLQVSNPINLPVSNYILLYELTPCSYIGEFAKHIAKQSGQNIVRICKSAAKQDKGVDIINIVDAGPAEFIYLFSNASLIITNSFHGSAFSINFSKPFFTVLPKRKQNNSRQRSLLELFNLPERILEEGATFPDVKDINIDYSSVAKLLDEERSKSITFLKNAIDGK